MQINYSCYSEIFILSNQAGERLQHHAKKCVFYYSKYPKDTGDLLMFALYFLDPNSSTRPFLRLEGDTKTEDFEKKKDDTAQNLQVLVNNLFPKYGIKTE